MSFGVELDGSHSATLPTRRSTVPSPALPPHWNLASVRRGWIAWQTFWERTAVVAIGFSIPVSTTLMEFWFAVLVASWSVSGRYREKLDAVRRNPTALVALALLALLTASLAWTSAAWEDALRGLLKYRNLAYVAIVATTVTDERLRVRGLHAFLAGMTLTLIASLAMSVGWWEAKWGHAGDCAVFKNHITQNLLMAFFAFAAAHEAVRTRRIVGWIAAAVAVGDLVFLVDGRTGHVVLAALVVLFLAQHLGRRGTAWATVVVAVGATAGCGLSPGLRARIVKAWDEASAYVQNAGQGVRLDNSIGLRLQFYETSLRVAAGHPVFGSGVGSFAGEYRRAVEPLGRVATQNPHNEYVLMLVQTGLAGLALVGLLFVVQWRNRAAAGPRFGYLSAGTVVALAVGCLVNSLLLDATEGNFYAYFAGLCTALGPLPAPSPAPPPSDADPSPT